MTPEFIPRYPGHEPSRFEDIWQAMDRRFDYEPVTRFEPTSPLAPPPPEEIPPSRPNKGKPRSTWLHYRGLSAER